MFNRNGAYVASRAVRYEFPASRRFFSFLYRLNNQAETTEPLPNTLKDTRSENRKPAGENQSDASKSVKNDSRKPLTFRKIIPQPPHVSEQMRTVMRTLPSPIVVLTTVLPGRKPVNRGMTLSSFTTLSLEPDPIITFNIKSTEAEPSLTFQALKLNRHFLLHVLEDGREGARLADIFTKGYGGRDGFKLGKAPKRVIQRTSDGEQISLSQLSVEGVKQVLRCEILEDGLEMTGVEGKKEGIVRVGDHMLIVARVNSLWDVGDYGGRFGLSYADGKYRSVGEEIEHRAMPRRVYIGPSGDES